MKKLLIGCGCLVLLIGGALAYLVFSMAPLIEEQEEVQERVTAELTELDSRHPFAATANNELDAERFERALRLRAALAERLERLESERRESEELGVGSLIPNMLARMNALVESVPAVLDEHELGPSELKYHTRVFWAVLAEDGNDPALASLRRRYSELKGAWSFLRQNHPRLDELPRLIDAPSAPVLEAARGVLAAQVELADEGVLEAVVEGVLLSLPDLDSGCMEAYASQRMAEITNRTFGDS